MTYYKVFKVDFMSAPRKPMDCVICGEEFMPHTRTQLTCGKLSCKDENHRRVANVNAKARYDKARNS